jgi:hypothetical protein
MNSQSQNAAITNAIGTATRKGHLTPISQQALLANLNATTIPSAIGDQVDMLESTIPCVVHIVVDSTGSLGPDRSTGHPGYEKIVVDAINSAVKDFVKMMDKTGQEIYLQVTEFSVRGGQSDIRIVRDFIHIQDFANITLADYQADGMTNLFDATFDGVTATSVFGASLFSRGATGVQEITVIISDGFNNAGSRSAADVSRFLLELNSKTHFVCAFVGIGEEADFRKIARGMGIPDGNIITVDKSLGGITHALKLVSSSVGNHSQAALAGGGVVPANTNFFSSVQS